MTDRPVIVGRYTWAGGYDPALTVWLGGSPHHWDGDQLVLHDDGREIRPEPGWLIVLWSDGMANAASPRVAERVYQPQPRGERVPLDHLTSDLYDELCSDLDRYEIIQGGMNEHAIDLARRAERAEAAADRLRADIAACREQQWPQRLGQAEKALNRVRRLAEFTRDHAAPAQDDMALAQHELACAVLDALDGPGPAAAQATEPGGWLLAGTRDLSIPPLPKFTAVHVTPEMERAATERAWQAAEGHEQATEWFRQHSSPHPAEALLARLVNAPDAAEHCHTVPPNWDGGGPCEYCTVLEEARALVASLNATKEN